VRQEKGGEASEREGRGGNGDKGDEETRSEERLGEKTERETSRSHLESSTSGVELIKTRPAWYLISREEMPFRVRMKMEYIQLRVETNRG